VVFGCDDKEETDDPIQDRSDTVKVFDGTSTVTVQVMGMTTKAEWDDIANKIAGRINIFYNENADEQNILKEMFNERGIIYIVEPIPVGYENIKTIGDGKTIYIALGNVDTSYVTGGLITIYSYGTEQA
jgi:hypothetical protein